MLARTIPLIAVLPLAAASIAAPPASAKAATATVVSSNWAGYAVAGPRFRRVSGTWKVAAGSCSGGSATYSASWLGIGGFSETSQALEQTGTEFDCSKAGRSTYSAWYELVPANAKTISMKVRPGDTMSASVVVQGKRVSLQLRNVTRRTTFARTLTMAAPDTTSAEWIVEAPSGCNSSGACTQLPLADFGTVPFTNARATRRSGHAGTISDTAWSATQLQLSQTSSAGAGRGSVSSAPGALASALSVGGGAFSVAYQSNSGFGKARTSMPVLKRPVG